MSALLALRNHFGSVRLVALQLFSTAGLGMVYPYINLYLTEIGFSGTLIGTLASAGAVLTLVLTPLLNQIADRLLLHRRLLMLYLGGFALSSMVFATTRNHLLVILAVLLFKVTVSPSMTLGAQLTLSQLIRSGKTIFGQMRSFSALGFAVASALAGQVFALGGYSLTFTVGALLSLVSVQLSTIFPAKPKEKSKLDAGPKAPRNRGIYVLAASQFFVTMCTHNAFAFLFIHLSQNLGVNNTHIGLWVALLAVVEFPFYYLTDALLPRVRLRITYIFGIVGIALSTLGLGIVPSLPMLLLLFVFRGMSWPAYQLSSYRLMNAISHPRNAATNQAIVQVTMPGIALLLTGSLYGWAYDHLGAGVFYALCALAAAVGVCIVIAGFRLFDARGSAPAT
ncbi:MAG: MFS transporter [Chloroflexota bacterium]|nr:MFS transporter [Chloroflexota bacterium]